MSPVARTKRYLVGLLIVGALTAIAGGGTFASFNATTSNNAALTTGVLVMSNTVTGGTGACYSSGPAGSINSTNTQTCADSLTLGSLSVPGVATPVTDLTISNIGNIPASALSMQAGATCSVASSGYLFTGINFTGSAPLSGPSSLCGQTEVAVFKTNAAFSTANGSGVCVYGNTAATDIAGAVSGTKCGFGPTYNLDDLGANYKSSDSGAGGATGTKGPIGQGALTANSGLTPSDYYLIGFKVIGTADNSFQGQKVTENVTWFMVQ